MRYVETKRNREVDQRPKAALAEQVDGRLKVLLMMKLKLESKVRLKAQKLRLFSSVGQQPHFHLDSDKKVPAGKVTDNTVFILSAIYLLLWEMRLQKILNAAEEIWSACLSVATPTVKSSI